MAKCYHLPPSAMRPLAIGYGSCIASVQITVDGKRVGYMYRENPDGSTDSGWRFFSGNESQSYADDAEHFEIYDVNTIANYDPGIIPFLDTDIGSAFARDVQGEFCKESMPDEPPSH